MKMTLATAATAATGSTIIGSDADRAFFLAVIGIVALVIFRILRKFKKDPIKTWKDFFAQNIVEIGLISVITPSTIRMVVDLIQPLINKF